MSEPLPLLDESSPWPVSTGTLGRTRSTPVVGPGVREPTVDWTYEHGGGLAAPPVVTRHGDVVLVDDAGRVSLLSADGGLGWSFPVDVEPVGTFNSPAVWRRAGRSLLSISHEDGVVLIHPGDGVVEDVSLEAADRFVCLREDGIVTCGRAAVSLLDTAGGLIDEHRFVWRSDDVACPTVGPDGAVYFLENREYAPTWDAEDQYLEVARVTFDGGAERESVVSVHAHTTDAVGSLCATEERLFWLLDSWRLGSTAYNGAIDEVDTDGFPTEEFPNRILGGAAGSVLLQREEAGQPMYELADGAISVWPVDDVVVDAVIDTTGTAYLLTDTEVHAVGPDGANHWKTGTGAQWLAAAPRSLIMADAEGSVMRLASPS